MALKKLGLGIETSCDESSLCLFDPETGRFVYEKTLTQIHAHAPFGGVVPDLASRLHLALLGKILEDIEICHPHWQQHVGWVAATTRPGLITSLLVGAVFGRSLAQFLQVPFIPVDHCEAHLYSSLLTQEGATVLAWDDIRQACPVAALIASGGHSFWIGLDENLQSECIGTTRDDAMGECYDKVARMLGLGYPGGPVVEQLAAEGNSKAFDLPVPMPEGLDFSLSGLKTAVQRRVMQERKMSEKFQQDMCASLQACLEKLVGLKTQRCIEAYQPKSVWFSGGVSANRGLRAQMAAVCRRNQVYFQAVPQKYAGDNAAMIAYLGYLKYKLTPDIKSQNARIVPTSVFSEPCDKNRDKYETKKKPIYSATYSAKAPVFPKLFGE